MQVPRFVVSHSIDWSIDSQLTGPETVYSQRNFFVLQNHREFSVGPSGKEKQRARVDMSAEVRATDATAKHFDLRLQLDDELISWAIPRGFSLDEEEQALGKTKARLAVETTPHYFSEGIREGQVMGRTCAALWDVGYYDVRPARNCGFVQTSSTSLDF